MSSISTTLTAPFPSCETCHSLTGCISPEGVLLTAFSFTSLVHCRNLHRIHRPWDQIRHFITGGHTVEMHGVQHVLKPLHFAGGVTADYHVEPFHRLAGGCRVGPADSKGGLSRGIGHESHWLGRLACSRVWSHSQPTTPCNTNNYRSEHLVQVSQYTVPISASISGLFSRQFRESVGIWELRNIYSLAREVNILKVPMKLQACTQRPNRMMCNYQVQGIYYVRMASQHFSCSANPFAGRTGKRGRDG